MTSAIDICAHFWPASSNSIILQLLSDAIDFTASALVIPFDLNKAPPKLFFCSFLHNQGHYLRTKSLRVGSCFDESNEFPKNKIFRRGCILMERIKSITENRVKGCFAIMIWSVDIVANTYQKVENLF